jgi:hypothetical protein
MTDGFFDRRQFLLTATARLVGQVLARGRQQLLEKETKN